jgi:hypothetical protein
MGLLPVLPDPAESLLSRGKESLRKNLGVGGERLKGALNVSSRLRSEVKTLQQKYPEVFDRMRSPEFTFKRLQRGYNWAFLLPDIDEIPGEAVGLYCQDVSFGEYNISETETAKYGVFKRGYAGFLDISTVKATFLCPIPDLVSVYLGTWKSKIITNGFYHPKLQYAKTATIKLLDRTGAASKEYQLEGMFPKTYPAHNLSYREEGIEVFNIEFNVDTVTLKGY